MFASKFERRKSKSCSGDLAPASVSSSSTTPTSRESRGGVLLSPSYFFWCFAFLPLGFSQTAGCCIKGQPLSIRWNLLETWSRRTTALVARCTFWTRTPWSSTSSPSTMMALASISTSPPKDETRKRGQRTGSMCLTLQVGLINPQYVIYDSLTCLTQVQKASRLRSCTREMASSSLTWSRCKHLDQSPFSATVHSAN